MYHGNITVKETQKVLLDKDYSDSKWASIVHWTVDIAETIIKDNLKAKDLDCKFTEV